MATKKKRATRKKRAPKAAVSNKPASSYERSNKRADARKVTNRAIELFHNIVARVAKSKLPDMKVECPTSDPRVTVSLDGKTQEAFFDAVFTDMPRHVSESELASFTTGAFIDYVTENHGKISVTPHQRESRRMEVRIAWNR